MHGSFCALGNAVPNIFGRLRSVPRHMGCPSGGSRLSSANGDGDSENDRKQCFHSTKVSLLPARMRLPTSLRRASQPDCSTARNHGLAPLRREQVVDPLVADSTAAVFSSERNPGEDARTLLVEPRM